MNLNVLNERAAKVAEKTLKAAFDDLRRLGNHLFEPEAKPLPVKLSGRGNATAFKAAAKQFFVQLDPDIFSYSINSPTLVDLIPLLPKAPRKSPTKKTVALPKVPLPVQQTRSRRRVIRTEKLGA